ncbi:MAG: hypothetical protein ABUS57_06830 [Pseudomonadota bacterium]
MTLRSNEDDEAWFLPKRYGYGAGFPIRWQGWVLLLAYVVGVTGATWFGGNYLQPQQQYVFIFGCIGVLTTLLVLIARAKTKGGWRWRWGDDD